MKSRTVPFPLMLTELALASWETMAYRTWMMASGTCSLAEYQKMTTEKMVAVQRMALAAMGPEDGRDAAMLSPWHRAASANAKRLRRKLR